MLTTIRINKDLQKQLKLKSVETGISQLELANRYIFDGLKKDDAPKEKVMSLEEIEKLIDRDKPEGNGLDKIDSLFTSDFPTNAVDLKKGRFYK